MKIEEAKWLVDESTVIKVDYVKRMGEIIGFKALQTILPLTKKNLDYLYRELGIDIFCSGRDGYTYSGAYDIADTAVCFLCEHLGKKLGDTIIDKFGKEITIKFACYREVNHYIRQERLSCNIYKP